MNWLRMIVSRHERRGIRLYIVCLVLYLLFALAAAEEASFLSGAAIGALWFLAIPLVVIGLQLVFPTILGWAVVLGVFVFYAVTNAYYLVLNFSWSQWRVDTSGFIMGLAVQAVVLGVCVALYRYRPGVVNGEANPDI